MAKVSLYIDKEVWAKFREEVFRKYGSLRKLSSEVETLLRSTLVEDKIMAQFEKLGVTTAGAISSRELRERRPVLRGPSSERIIKEMRQKRVAETLPRQ